MQNVQVFCPNCSEIVQAQYPYKDVRCPYCNQLVYFSQEQKMKLLCECGKKIVIAQKYTNREASCPRCTLPMYIPKFTTSDADVPWDRIKTQKYVTNSTQQVVPVHKDSILFDTNPLARIASYDNPNLPDPFQEQEKLLSSIPEPSPISSFDYPSPSNAYPSPTSAYSSPSNEYPSTPNTYSSASNVSPSTSNEYLNASNKLHFDDVEESATVALPRINPNLKANLGSLDFKEPMKDTISTTPEEKVEEDFHFHNLTGLHPMPYRNESFEISENTEKRLSFVVKVGLFYIAFILIVSIVNLAFSPLRMDQMMDIFSIFSTKKNPQRQVVMDDPSLYSDPQDTWDEPIDTVEEQKKYTNDSAGKELKVLADQAKHQKNYLEALEKYKEASLYRVVRLSNQLLSEIMFSNAYIYHAIGDKEHAHNAIQELLKTNRQYTPVYILWGDMYAEEEDFEKALELYQTAQESLVNFRYPREENIPLHGEFLSLYDKSIYQWCSDEEITKKIQALQQTNQDSKEQKLEELRIKQQQELIQKFSDKWAPFWSKEYEQVKTEVLNRLSWIDNENKKFELFEMYPRTGDVYKNMKTEYEKEIEFGEEQKIIYEHLLENLDIDQETHEKNFTGVSLAIKKSLYEIEIFKEYIIESPEYKMLQNLNEDPKKYEAYWFWLVYPNKNIQKKLKDIWNFPTNKKSFEQQEKTIRRTLREIQRKQEKTLYEKMSSHILAYWFHRNFRPQETEIITQHKIQLYDGRTIQGIINKETADTIYFSFIIDGKIVGGTDILKSNIKSKTVEKVRSPMVEQQKKTFEKIMDHIQEKEFFQAKNLYKTWKGKCSIPGSQQRDIVWKKDPILLLYTIPNIKNPWNPILHSLRECPECLGAGTIPCTECRNTHTFSCEECNGTGKVVKDNQKIDCPECNGIGSFSECPTCKGTKKVPCDECDQTGGNLKSQYTKTAFELLPPEENI